MLDGMQLPIICKRDTKDMKNDESSWDWEWLRSENLRRKAESALIAAFLKRHRNARYSTCLVAST